MRRISIESKQAIIAKALGRGEKSLEQVAEENSVGYSTLQKWLRCQREGRPLPGIAENQDQTPPLKHLLATSQLDEQAIGAYCRKHGIHSFQLKQWETELMSHKANQAKASNANAEIKDLRRENKALKKDLRRKEKALAETSALLVLKKKADLIWGAKEDD